MVLGTLINAAKLVGKSRQDLPVVINGAGATGIAIAKLLRCIVHVGGRVCTPIKEIILCDSKGLIHRER